MTIPKVSIIIPVYNVEKYIERCVRTLFAQTLDELEYIFVDDCSPDKSIEVMQRVLEDYPARKSQVKLIRHESNQGVSQSRQDGVDAATGEYIIHCDPDDWVELDMYEQLYNKAKETNADIVICDFIEESLTAQRRPNVQIIPSQKEILKLRIAIGDFHTGLWNKLVSHSYIKISKIRFHAEISLWEDMAYMVPLLFLSTNIAKVNLALYHYIIDIPNSIVNGRTLKSVKSQIDATNYILNCLCDDLNVPFEDRDLLLLQLRAKNGLLIKGMSFNPSLWRKTFPLTNSQFYKLPISFGQKIIYFFTILKMDLIVSLLARFRK